MNPQKHTRDGSSVIVGDVAVAFVDVEQAVRLSELMKNGYVRVLVDGEPAA
jgi:hypothetical protein